MDNGEQERAPKRPRSENQISSEQPFLESNGLPSEIPNLSQGGLTAFPTSGPPVFVEKRPAVARNNPKEITSNQNEIMYVFLL